MPLEQRADAIQTFAASGTFKSGSALSGTVTIDTTTGMATAVDLMVGPPASVTFTFIQAQFTFASAPTIQTGTTASSLPHFNFGLAGVTTLVNYNGGALSGGSDIFYSTTHIDLIDHGALAPAPEPSLVWLLGTALLAGLLLTRKQILSRAS